WSEDDIFRQTISLLIVTNLGAYILYFFFATLSYYFVYDHSLMKHPQFLKNQVYREIMFTVQSLQWISIPTVLLFLLELRGYGKLYDDIGEFPSGWFRLIISILSFLFFTDMLIYWIHRGLHHRLVYKRIHKPHHLWKIPTPFASHAFHPVHGFLQSLPYHIYPFIFPLHKVVYLSLYILVNIWTISIHDGDFRVPQILRPFINGSAHHTDHHMFFDYNYGQYFTLWDRIAEFIVIPGNELDKMVIKGNASPSVKGGRAGYHTSPSPFLIFRMARRATSSVEKRMRGYKHRTQHHAWCTGSPRLQLMYSLPSETQTSLLPRPHLAQPAPNSSPISTALPSSQWPLGCYRCQATRACGEKNNGNAYRSCKHFFKSHRKNHPEAPWNTMWAS
ncbi:lathosterol oxidase-like, partial [Vulpes vulpes]|uniref:Lathosterol oxidase-like n=1 Tax=Vulpes vulpes TaxID=9627 RepID=A0ABM4YVB7_VULVU